MKLLLIEDDLDAVKGIKDHYEDKKWSVITSGFEKASDQIQRDKPDIIVMDWMEDFDSDKDRGRPIFNENQNLPIIVFSGAADSLSLDIASDNPFIEQIAKGDEQNVINKIDEWEKYLTVLTEVKSQINDAALFMAASLKPALTLNSYPGDAVVKFMLNKQAAEYFNSKLTDDETNPTWTQYLYPPLSKNLLVADILKSTTKNKYAVVLTPSCDMARVKQEKDLDILVAFCEEAEKFHNYGKANTDEKYQKKVEEVSKMLSYGYNKGKVSLPELPEVFPYLTINLKDLCFIKLSKISLDIKHKEGLGFEFYRIASINSPYREQIVWAHMVNSCRPGVPDRNYKAWAKNILK